MDASQQHLQPRRILSIVRDCVAALGSHPQHAMAAHLRAAVLNLQVRRIGSHTDASAASELATLSLSLPGLRAINCDHGLSHSSHAIWPSTRCTDLLYHSWLINSQQAARATNALAIRYRSAGCTSAQSHYHALAQLCSILRCAKAMVIADEERVCAFMHSTRRV